MGDIVASRVGAVVDLLIKKTLKENLPTSVDSSRDELHFTEDGGIYLSKSDGTLRQVGVDDETMKNIKNLTSRSVGLVTRKW